MSVESSDESLFRNPIFAGSLISICFLLLGLLLGFILDWEFGLYFIIIAFLSFVITLLYSFIFRIKKPKLPNLDFELFSIMDIDKEENGTNLKKESDEEKVYYYIERITNPPKEEKCRISFRSLENEEEAIQCIFCKAYFIEEYLKRWLLEDLICPVCKAILVSNVAAEIENT